VAMTRVLMTRYSFSARVYLPTDSNNLSIQQPNFAKHVCPVQGVLP
jgi:hypothetical protein